MKINLLSAAFALLIFSASCSDTADKDKTDSTATGEMQFGDKNHIEDLLKIKDENELKSKYAAVTYDTIWGPEGMYIMGTYIDKGTKDEVQISWEDSLHRSGVASVTIDVRMDSNGNYTFASKWSSASGVKLGMTTDELQQLNGKAFTFSGFDWDYGGGVMEWNKGKLDNAMVGVQLGYQSPMDLPEAEMGEVMGDQDVSSDNAVVKKLKPRVTRVSVY